MSNTVNGSTSNTFGDVVRAHREAAGKSHQDVAAAMGVDRTWVAHLEAGHRTPRTAPTVEKIAAALAIPRYQAYAAAGVAPPELAEALAGVDAAELQTIIEFARSVAGLPRV